MFYFWTLPTLSNFKFHIAVSEVIDVKKVRITVVKKVRHDDLIARYENRLKTPATWSKAWFSSQTAGNVPTVSVWARGKHCRRSLWPCRTVPKTFIRAGWKIRSPLCFRATMASDPWVFCSKRLTKNPTEPCVRACSHYGKKKKKLVNCSHATHTKTVSTNRKISAETTRERQNQQSPISQRNIG